jgi:MbtH protein
VAHEVRYHVVVNEEEQYSTWPSGTPCPVGWRTVGISGTETECLNWIECAWTDLRPRSLRPAIADAPGDEIDTATVRNPDRTGSSV